MTTTPFNLSTFPIEADLSRADVRVLHALCQGKRVVEFGCGGSTALLAAFASRVWSYDTDPAWIARTNARLDREPDRSHVTVERCDETTPVTLPSADVYFIDGYVPLRPVWIHDVITRRLTKTIVVHDSRSSAMSDVGRVLVYPLTLFVRSLEYHTDGSNMLIIRVDAAVEYANWNEAEPENRLPFLA